MPLSMKIQPIDPANEPEIGLPEPAKPPPPVVIKSRLKRLFRISVSEPAPTAVPAQEVFEPSSICLAKMVQNFIEESTEKPSQSPAVRCGRNRCNCFHGNGSDGSDTESDTTITTTTTTNVNVSSADACDFVKSLVVCVSVNERKVLADTARIVSEKRTCKRKDELRKFVVDGLIGLGYDAAICKSKWDKSPSFPAGEYEYVDVIMGGERLIIDIDLRSEFEVARSTKTYKSILQILPHIFVGKSERLSKIICIISEAAKQSLKKKGLHIPPWRKTDYVQAKWLSPPTRIVSAPAMVTPPPSPLSPAPTSSVIQSDDVLSPDKVTGLLDHCQSKLSSSSPSSESIFDMSESSGEEEIKEKESNPNPKKKGSDFGVEVITTGLASIMEESL